MTEPEPSAQHPGPCCEWCLAEQDYWRAHDDGMCCCESLDNEDGAFE